MQIFIRNRVSDLTLFPTKWDIISKIRVWTSLICVSDVHDVTIVHKKKT